MSRFGFNRSRPVYDGQVVGTPVNSTPWVDSGDSYGGPVLDQPTWMESPSTGMPYGADPFHHPAAADDGVRRASSRPVPGTVIPPGGTCADGPGRPFLTHALVKSKTPPQGTTPPAHPGTA